MEGWGGQGGRVGCEGVPVPAGEGPHLLPEAGGEGTSDEGV